MTCIVVLGIPRSGSSMVAGICHHLGLYMGDEFFKDDRINPRGLFEDIEFFRLHQDVSLTLGIDEPQIPTMNYDGVIEYMGEEWKTKYESLISVRNKRPAWGVKEPRFCYMLPHFQNLVERDIRIVSISRDRNESIKSMMVSHKLLEEGADYTVARNEKAKQESLAQFDGEVLDVSYQNVLDNPKTEGGRIAEFIRLPTSQSAIDFVDPTLQHHKEKA